MSDLPGPVTAEDVDEVVDAAVQALSTRLERDWHVRAGSLEWDCWETIEHVSDDLFAYAAQLAPTRSTPAEEVPFDYRPRRPGGPANTIFGDPDAGTAGLVQVLDACGGLLAAVVRTASPTARAHHVFGRSDPEGFAAMGVVEVLVHLHDVAGALELGWEPAGELCDRVLARLFPDAPTDTERWPTLLWATGRGELPGRPRLETWQWHGCVRSDPSGVGS